MNRQIITHDPRDRVTLLYRLSQTFNSSLNLDEVLNRVIDEVITAIHAENGFMVLRQADGKLDFPVARGMDRTVIDDPQSPVVLEILTRVIEQGKPVLISNTMVKNRSTNHRKRNTLESISILCVPLTIRGNIIGALYLENCCDAGVFSQEDVELLDTIGASAAIAIENARLYREAVEKGRMEHELQVARKVQRDFLPRMLCQPLNWEISARLEAAREVGGDFYDVISLDEDRLVGLVLGDVCDKGVGSALFMALFRSLIRAFAEQHVCADGKLANVRSENRMDPVFQRDQGTGQSTIDISTLVNTVYLTNQYINNHHYLSNMFTTLFIAVIDPANGNMAYVNCGHEPPILVNNRVIKDRLNPTGPVLGILPDMKFQVKQLVMTPGDTLLAYTDGVIDAMDVKGEPFSKERLLSLAQIPAESTEALLDKITASLQTHIGDHNPYDDIALLAARWVRAGN
jgi:sigma-B regulation protein RsbU (phosphoserine phosphatase)